MVIKLNPLHSSGRGLCKNRGKAGLCSLQPPVPCTSWSINVAVTREEFLCLPVPVWRGSHGCECSELCSTVWRWEKAAVDQPLDLLTL